ncbi:hypothetical protein FT643_19440 [Ketobacter sp. MCCC 1A13808]|uniref:hypothetical protein n=1 Tax=Ketobacter sp. MCCC 1A13808 TaxID=2602738 RepID=UPI0012EB2CB0|nr:hypothetical protein [Ketobacter sp. MCCC 1A13808]MVF14316.1 hypothetical protein [Ketobacter sp. MCCC 1A13808]
MSFQPQSLEHLVEKIRHLPLERVAEVEDFVDFLCERTKREQINKPHTALDFPVLSAGQWPQELELSREEIYGDDGR